MEGMTPSEDRPPVKDRQQDQRPAGAEVTGAREPAGPAPCGRLTGILRRPGARARRAAHVLPGAGTRGRPVLRWLVRLALVIVLALGGILSKRLR
jgi:hypothetical protein